MSKGLEAFNNYILSRLKPSDIAFLDVRNAINQTKNELKALEIIKRFVWLENDEIHLGLYGDSEIVLRENDFETETEFNLIKEWLER